LWNSECGMKFKIKNSIRKNIMPITFPSTLNTQHFSRRHFLRVGAASVAGTGRSPITMAATATTNRARILPPCHCAAGADVGAIDQRVPYDAPHCASRWRVVECTGSGSNLGMMCLPKVSYDSCSTAMS